MLTRLRIQNFKQFKDVEIELGQSVVLIGPNNSGKTSALQAVAMWALACNLWEDHVDVHINPYRYDEKSSEQKFVVNRFDLLAIPIPYIQLLWHNLHVTNGESIYFFIQVDGFTRGEAWSQEFKFKYENEETLSFEFGETHDLIMDLSPKVAFLPPMSGLVSTEDKLEMGSINRRIGEGRTAEVLRNLCYQVYEKGEHWLELVRYIRRMFGVEMLPPQYLISRGELRMVYKDQNGITLDLSSAGRGMLQILLLLAYLYQNPGAVLLLDEPDAHLEILRQREVYQLLTSVAREQGSQIIAASHSEVVLNEAADRDLVIAFIGKPHRMNKRDQVLKALRDIPFDHYYQAEQTGWVLYIEGATDLAILRAFAQKLNHPAQTVLDRVFVHPVNINEPQRVREHFYGLREAKPDLVGIALFDRLDKRLGTDSDLTITMWNKREIENYLCLEDVLIAYARQGETDESAEHHVQIMREAIDEISTALRILNRPSAWSDDIKASDDFLAPLFARYYQKLGLPNLMVKTNFHVLADYITIEQIDAEVMQKLDLIVETAKRGRG